MKESTKIGLFFGSIFFVLGGIVIAFHYLSPEPHLSLSGASLLILGLFINILCFTKNYPNIFNLDIFK